MANNYQECLQENLILIVDDNRQNREVMETILQDEGYNTITASRGQEALDILQENERISLVLLDVLMPGLDGITVCKKIKFTLEREDLPVIMVTALNAREDRLRGLEAGADDFVSKPIDWPELISRVKSALRLKRAHDRIQSQYDQLQQQLQLARQVQQNLATIELPDGLKGEIFYETINEVGGDVYDLFKLDQDRYGLFLADCMGHGVAAAMVMVMVKLILRNLELAKLSPGKVMTAVNSRLRNLFSDNIDEMFVTAVYMEYDVKADMIIWSNGGHPAPLLLAKDKSGEENNQQKLEKLAATNMPLGIIADNNYKEQSISATDYSCLLLYTDGLVDFLEPASSELGSESIKLLKEKTEGDYCSQTTVEPSGFYKHLKARLEEETRDDDISYLLLQL